MILMILLRIKTDFRFV